MIFKVHSNIEMGLTKKYLLLWLFLCHIFTNSSGAKFEHFKLSKVWTKNNRGTRCISAPANGSKILKTGDPIITTIFSGKDHLFDRPTIIIHITIDKI